MDICVNFIVELHFPPNSCLFDKYHEKRANDYDVPHARSINDDQVFPCCGLFELEEGMSIITVVWTSYDPSDNSY